MAKNKSGKNCIWHLVCFLLLALSFLAVVRSLFFGLDVDEKYAVVLSSRLAGGDLLLKELWEPHQTSAILPALLIRLYLKITGDSAFLILFLRISGILIQGAAAFFWYLTVRDSHGKKAAFFTALVFFHTLPKGIVTPEFTNQLLWFWILSALFLIRFYRTGKARNCFAAGIFLCFTVLAYPSCALLYLPYGFLLFRKSRKAFALFTLACLAGAGLFVGYLLSYLNIAEILFYVRQILSDPSHDIGMGTKFLGYGREALEILLRTAVYALIGGILLLVWRFLRPRQPLRITVKLLFSAALAVAAADQIRLWALNLTPCVHPQIHYLLLFLFGLFYRKKEELFDLLWLPSLWGFFSVLLLTNLDMKASFVHLLPGMLYTLLMIGKPTSAEPAPPLPPSPSPLTSSCLFLLLWSVILIGARGYLVRDDAGTPTNIFFVKQKALYGPAKNIYCPYRVGARYNNDYTFLNSELPKGARILYLGGGMLLDYLAGDYEICTPSTISTPVFNEQLFVYFSCNPDKFPEYLLVDKAFGVTDEQDSGFLKDWIPEHFDTENKTESEFLYLLKRK